MTVAAEAAVGCMTSSGMGFTSINGSDAATFWDSAAASSAGVS